MLETLSLGIQLGLIEMRLEQWYDKLERRKSTQNDGVQQYIDYQNALNLVATLERNWMRVALELEEKEESNVHVG